MFIYYSLFLPQHNFDSIMFRIQLLVVHKFNQNVVAKCLPLNLKHAYKLALFTQALSSFPELIQSKMFFKFPL